MPSLICAVPAANRVLLKKRIFKIDARSTALPVARRSLACRASLEENPLFTEQFRSVLQESLARQGQEALTANSRPAEPRISATEEVLTTALVQSKQTLMLMCQWRDQLDKQLAIQQKQVERLEFAVNKCKSDAAYMNALKDLMHDS